MSRDPLIETCVAAVFHAVLVTSLFFLFRGHNAPGGGFIAGLVAGTALLLRYLAGRPARTPRPATVLGLGLLVAAGAAVAPLLGGGQVLQSGYTALDLPVLGSVALPSALVFDVGVFLVVVGMVLGVLRTLAAQEGTSLAPVHHDEQQEGV